jgi:hypothetical protein
LHDDDRLPAGIGGPPHGRIPSPTRVSTTVVSTIVVVVSTIVSTFLNPVWHIPTIFIAVVSTVIDIAATTSVRIVQTARVDSVGPRLPSLWAICPR